MYMRRMTFVLAVLTACGDGGPVAVEPEPCAEEKLHLFVQQAVRDEAGMVGILIKISRPLDTAGRQALEGADLAIGTVTASVVTGRIDTADICPLAALPFVTRVQMGHRTSPAGLSSCIWLFGLVASFA